MREREPPQQPPRARPLSEPAVAELSDCADELARAWAQALLSELPLARIGELDLARVADCGPALCRAVIAALASDAALAELLDGSRRVFGAASAAEAVAALAGSLDAPDAPGARVAVVEALRGALWERIGAALASANPRAAADAADRLASVCARLAAGALAGCADSTPAHPSEPEGPGAVRGRASEGRFAPLGETVPEAAPPFRIVDEHGRLQVDEPGLGQPGPAHDPGTTSAHAGGRPRGAGAIAVQDRRNRPAAAGERGPGAWIEAIGGALERHELDRAPFAVLLIEAGARRGGSRLGDRAGDAPAGARPEALAEADARELERHVLAVVLGSPGAGLTRERAGRWWLLVPHHDRGAAQALAETLTHSLREDFAARGLGLEIAIGTASCPQDAREAASLASHADVGLYAARAAARQA
jgi:hypothetical protein